MGREDQIVVLDDKIVHRDRRQIEFETLPIRAVVEGNVDAVFGAGEEKPGLLRIFPDGADEGAVRNSVHELRPGGSVVGGFEDVRAVVVVLVAIDGNPGCSGISSGGINLADAAPFWQLFRGDVAPSFSSIACDLHEAVIRACPNLALGDRRFGDRKDRVVILGAGVVFIDGAAGNFLLALIVAGEIGANGFPVHAAVGSLKKALACVVEDVGIVWGNQERRGPLEAVVEDRGSAAVGKLGRSRDALGLASVAIIAGQRALVVAGVHDEGIGRVRSDVARFAAAYGIPVGAVDGAIVAAAGDRDS